jgi:polyisoprenoid-binding protein YceI
MKWAIDPNHSTVTFSIRHMMTRVRGEMKIKDGWIESDHEDPSGASVAVVLDASTINTGVEARDNHLRSPDGNFDVANYPTITFKSKRIEGKDRSNFKVIGDVTIHGITKEVALNASFSGEAKDPWGNRRVGFAADTTLNRKDFNLTWNQTLETGGFLLGDDVKLDIDVEALPAPTQADAEAEIDAEAALEAR